MAAVVQNGTVEHANGNGAISADLDAIRQKLDALRQAQADEAEAFLKESDSLDEKCQQLQFEQEAAGRDQERLRQELEKVQEELKTAERAASVTRRLLENEAKTSASEREEKMIARLESERQKGEEERKLAENKVEEERTRFEAAKEELASQIEALETQMKEEAEQADAKLKDFQAASRTEKENLQKKLNELRDEDSLIRANFLEVSDALKTSESGVTSLQADVEGKKEELGMTESEYVRKVGRAKEDSTFLLTELARVKLESDRKKAQLEGLHLEKILDDLNRTREAGEQEVRKLKLLVETLERDVTEAALVKEKATEDHAAMSKVYSSKKEEILAETEGCREARLADEKRVAELKKELQELSDKSWGMHTKYAEKMEEMLKGGVSSSQVTGDEQGATSSGGKKKKKAAAASNAPQIALSEEQKKLAHLENERTKEKEQSEQLTARLNVLDKELRAEKKKREKAEKLSHQGGGANKNKGKTQKDQQAARYAEENLKIESSSGGFYRYAKSLCPKWIKKSQSQTATLVVICSSVLAVLAFCDRDGFQRRLR
ncbi:unnamed protein product [Amoebophrya sp. A25]|nr:unnamed protein product [Amoebophrya sp. A25]|eukprot:GSA25T00019814001.1